MSENPHNSATFVAGGHFMPYSLVTPMGRRGNGGQRIRVALQFRDADGKELERVRIANPRIDGGAIDDDPLTWQTISVPFAANVPKEAARLDRIIVQLCDMPQDGRNGLVVRSFRFAK